MNPNESSARPTGALLTLALVVAAVTIMVPVESEAGSVCDPVEIEKVVAGDGGAFDEFGVSIAVSRGTIVVGSWRDDEGGADAGAAYVYVLRAGEWVFQSKLIAEDAADGDRFGTAVAIDGNTIVVGAFWDDDEFIDSGAAYVFVRSEDTWTQQAKLVAEDPFPNHLLGYCVAVEGDTAVAGAIRDEVHGFASGAAYVFVRNGEAWAQQAKLVAKDGEHNDRFGISVGVSGDWALIGAFWDDDANVNAGTVYAYRRVDGQWTQRHTINAKDADVEDRFGASISMSGDRAVVGAFFDNERAPHAGAAYILAIEGNRWVQEAKLIADDGGDGDQFGGKVSLDGDLALVGSARHDGFAEEAGAAYLFRRTNGAWDQQARLTAADGGERDRFGHSVGVSGDVAAVGALFDDDMGEMAGAGYVFELNCVGECRRDPEWICDGDVDGDGQVNPVDAGLVQAAFGSADSQDLCNYDIDCDGQINPVDAGIVQSLFGTCETPREVCP